MIKRVTHRLDARLYRVVALGTPNERERAQWYFQRYVACPELCAEVGDGVKG